MKTFMVRHVEENKGGTHKATLSADEEWVQQERGTSSNTIRDLERQIRAGNAEIQEAVLRAEVERQTNEAQLSTSTISGPMRVTAAQVQRADPRRLDRYVPSEDPWEELEEMEDEDE